MILNEVKREGRGSYNDTYEYHAISMGVWKMKITTERKKAIMHI